MSVRHLFLVLFFALAQWTANAHAVEHALGDEGAIPGHVCQLCLAAHDLSAAAPATAAATLVLPLAYPWLAPPQAIRPSLKRLRACQRGPPFF